jgi:hypothetical protein
MIDRPLIGLVFFTMTAITATARPEDNTLSEREDQDGWQLLFEGKTTKGWMTPGQKPLPDSHVQDSGLNPHPCDSMLAYERPLENFALLADVDLAGSGVGDQRPEDLPLAVGQVGRAGHTHGRDFPDSL